MRALTALLWLLLAGPAWADLPRLREGFNAPLAASVFSAALAFIDPRSLEAASVQQLAIWGLAAPASLDGGFATDIRDGAVVLLRNGMPVARRPLPPDSSAEAWGLLAAEILEAASQLSPALRNAGTQGLTTAFFEELFNHLDPYSRYVPPGAADADRKRRSGEGGAGITVGRSRAGFVVTGANAGGPGAEAGVRPGDLILEVDRQPTSGEELETVRGWIAGPDGSELSLTLRTGRQRARVVELERAVTPPETVQATRLGDALLLRISAFSVDTDQRLQQELERALSNGRGRGIKGVILDLRGNRGGRLAQAVAATDLLQGRGMVAITAGRNPQAAHDWRATGIDLAEGRPIVVLVDGRSASAAEIMAAALADQGRGVVVGSATLGKGLVQTIKDLPDGGELFVSWSRVLAPADWPIQGLGVLPQLCTSLGEATLQQQMQALERGQAPMRDAIVRHHEARAPVPAAEILALRNPCPAAEAREADMAAARWLLGHPQAYEAARLRP